MKLALVIKWKFRFVDGSMPKLSPSTSKFEAWEQCDAIVHSWICHSVCDTIEHSVVFLKSGRDVWEDLCNRFATQDVFKLADLMMELQNLKQGDLSVTNFFTQL